MLVVDWLCFGYVSVQFGYWNGSLLVLHWYRFVFCVGNVLVLYVFYIVIVLVLEIVFLLVVDWLRFGLYRYSLSIELDCTGIVLRSCWYCIGIVRVLYWFYVGIGFGVALLVDWL